MPRFTAKVGMKLKVIRGDDESIKPHEVGKCDHAVWIAGRIPVGTIGTVVRQENSNSLALDFGPDYPAILGYCYGILNECLDSQFQIVD